ncbi:hypothetical protein [Taklimakanibacter lacteus]|uniref:hypothetical protein n=1 Tax=Taklimakanibacter lacteus TaxID=2268456 RepID=UPI0013C48D70
MTQVRADKIAPHLWTRLALLGPGDLSVNQAAVVQPESLMVTGHGSPNDALWSEMVEIGWTREIRLDQPVLTASRAFAFTDAGIRVMTEALAELARQRAALLAKIGGYSPGSAPASVTAVCERIGYLSTKLLALLIMAKGRASETHEGGGRHAEYLAALEAIARGVEAAARAVGDAIAAGPDSDDGRDWLDRTTKALDYADHMLGLRTERS